MCASPWFFLIGKRQMTCALVKQSSRWHGRMPDVQNCALGVQKADDMCNLVSFPINPCHLFIVVFGCAGWTSKTAHVILYNLQQKGTWHEHTTEGKHTKKEWKHTQKIILRRFSYFNVIFLHVWWVFIRVSPKAGTKTKILPKTVKNPFLNTFLIQILTEK